uniref:Ovule protein n=1 Tax=Steinernema glaseri TaxID=37863 RepID=A0A1I7YZD8_9BILA
MLRSEVLGSYREKKHDEKKDSKNTVLGTMGPVTTVPLGTFHLNNSKDLELQGQETTATYRNVASLTHFLLCLNRIFVRTKKDMFRKGILGSYHEKRHQGQQT